MFKDPQNWFLPCSKPRNSGDKVGWLMTSSQEQIQHYSYHVVKKQSLCSLGKNYKIIKYFCWAKLVLYKVPFLHHFVLEVWLSQIIVELAECSPIIIQNSSNPLSQKNLDVWPYNCTTAQGATFNMRGVLCHGHASATTLFSSPVVSALDSEVDDLGSSPGRGKALCPWDKWGKKMQAPPLSLAKSIYYCVVKGNIFSVWCFLCFWVTFLSQ